MEFEYALTWHEKLTMSLFSWYSDFDHFIKKYWLLEPIMDIVMHKYSIMTYLLIYIECIYVSILQFVFTCACVHSTLLRLLQSNYSKVTCAFSNRSSLFDHLHFLDAALLVDSAAQFSRPMLSLCTCARSPIHAVAAAGSASITGSDSLTHELSEG